jgi:hypothetical protein
VVESRCFGHVLDVATVGVGGCDPFLEAVWPGGRAEKEDELPTVGRPGKIARERAAVGRERDLGQAGAVGMDDEQRSAMLERDLRAVGRPTAVVVNESARSDPLGSAAAEVDDEERVALMVGTGAGEDDLGPVGGIVDRAVGAARVRGDSRQAAPVGGADRVDAVQAGVGLTVALSRKPCAIR